MTKIDEVLRACEELNPPIEDLGSLDEAGISRLIRHARGKTYAIMSAFRKYDKNDKTKTYSLKDNRARNRKLMAELVKVKAGPIHLTGHWPEAPDGTDYETAKKQGRLDMVQEESFFIPKPESMTDDEFKDFILKMVNKFDQDAAIFATPDEVGELFKNGSYRKIGTKLTTDKAGELYSQMRKRNKDVTFVFEGVRVPDCFGSAHAFRSAGLGRV